MEKIVFDVTPMVEAEIAPVYRTGIYTVSLNVFLEMNKREDVDLAFWVQNRMVSEVKRILTDKFEIENPVIVNRSGALVNFLSKCWFRNEVSRLKHKKGTVYYGKCVIRNILQGMIDFFDRGLVDEVKMFNHFFSPYRQAPKQILDCKDIKKTIFVHDVIAYIFPECFPRFNKKTTKHWLKELVETANGSELFVANSECTKKDFLKVCTEIGENRVKVAPLACASRYQKKNDADELAAIREKYGIPNKKYVFSLCSIEPRKNLIRQIESFSRFIKENGISDMLLVMGGGAWNSFENDFRERLAAVSNLNDFLCLIGYVADDDLPYLYSGAEWFVYTSQYEGFGLPALEAMACGCPVIVSNNSSLPEVVGDAGVQITWDSEDEHVAAFKRYYYDAEFRNSMADMAYLRARDFGWGKTVDIILEEMKKDGLINTVEE